MHTSLYDMYDSGEEVINNDYEIELLMQLDPSELVTMINEEFGSELHVDYNIEDDKYYVHELNYDCDHIYNENGFLTMVEELLLDIDHEEIVELVERYN